MLSTKFDFFVLSTKVGMTVLIPIPAVDPVCTSWLLSMDPTGGLTAISFGAFVSMGLVLFFSFE